MSTAAAHPEHGPEDPCPEGIELYARALREGGIDSRDASPLPCLLDSGLLRPDARDAARLEPVPPALVLHRMLRTTTDRVAHERRREQRLAEAFAPLLRTDVRGTEAAENPAIRVVSGTGPINEAISKAMTGVVDELLCVQPNVHYNDSRGAAAQVVAMDRDQALLDRGARIRTLYQHTQRHMPLVLARYEQLRGDAEARSLDEVTDRLIVADRDVAFIPAGRDGTVALEIRHPALVEFFAATFYRLWWQATPMYPQTVHRPSLNGVTPRQRAIAGLLVEGHTDAVIADRLGMNIRTARVHIAKLAATLGSESRAQLGYLIGRSGILDRGA
ncbi:DNA-binding CsgD family transcriptional regulator [Streptomyces sp. SAI-208]|uniref:helix-turn-helix transcriptional regulator n=1 Tax=unclassified Streptomyces TaxID=2593676 RepID=UPI002475C858|nr:MULTISPECIES: helix-turn-helix transcriptional regulator [unclassified Streptomyces]MDH6517630.1 DNA-binding CsgD family transcriptional regulator [Streptomyces sp. SAI-090]MDH6549853.1 DNA-binding CsgD family transcriptional regulator [Streptomyces sp. SAI-041]MDH6568905.1 DNA-binding CsgD family transcriptional regulator [Streptomyces sp. SAI-117]MDH6586141.1 DNA-binding CsgD family transcriptional regulator [Streptomyces sp. SAI-133]MDH6608479.1 DNA-binding CsgD family transcriptional re